MKTKSDIRSYVNGLKKSMTEDEITNLSRIIADKLMAADEYVNNSNILIYVSYNQEVRTDDIIRKSIDNGKNVYVPKVFKKASQDKTVKYMEFVKIQSMDELEPGYMGIMEPVSDEHEVPDGGLMIMPGIAFDNERNRIGYGGGFYDRYLSEHMNDYYKTAICFDYQVVESIQADEFDIKPDKIITDRRIV